MVLSQAYLDWERKTEERGLQQGLQQERALILRLPSRRVGTVPELLQVQINALPIDALEKLGDALLDFNNLSELERWLHSYSLDRNCH
jgi:Domain of unknown function (DUF4351)